MVAKCADDRYLVSGSKFFVTSPGEDVYLVPPIDSRGPEGFSLLLAEKGAPEMSFGKV
jgi:alkylation response protein AidB-like acyl-CoA dehydrogenase